MGRAAFRSWLLAGGSFRPERGIPLSDRGFRYGQHLFESIAVRNGKLLLLGPHLDLLGAAARRAGFPFPGRLRTELRRGLTDIAGAVPCDGMMRVYLTAGPGAPAAAVTSPGCYITWEETPFPGEADLSAGFRLVTLDDHIAGAGWGEKSGNYAHHLAALSTARSGGGDEGIVLDAKGRVVSCAMGNLIAWFSTGGETVPCTPDPSLGARSGALLGWVGKRLPLTFRAMRRADLRRATSLAVTNSRLGVMPVRSLDGRSLPDNCPALDLARDYLRLHG